MSYIYVEKSDLEWATQQGLITTSEESRLWPALVQRTAGRGGLNLAQLAFYSGALLIMGALTWFMTVVWANSILLFFLALGYTTVFGTVGLKLWYDGPAQYGIPQVVGGLFVTVAVVVSPVMTYALQAYFHYWPISQGLPMELTSIILGAVALYYVRFSFLTMPISVAFFFFTNLDLASLIWHNPTTSQLCYLSFGFGLAMDIVAFFVDRQKFQQDFGYWPYLFGTLTNFMAATCLFFQGNAILGPYSMNYAVFCVVEIVLAWAVNRRVLVVFGAIGEAYYLLWLSTDLFYNSWYYPLVLTGVGIFIIVVGIQIQKFSNRNPSASHTNAEEIEQSPKSVNDSTEAYYAPVNYMPVHQQQMPIYYVLPASVPKVAEV